MLTPGPNNSYLVKRKSGGGSQFSRDPLNLMNKHSRKVSLLCGPFELVQLLIMITVRRVRQ